MFIKCLLIKPCSIEHLSYNDPNYIKNILEYIEEIDIDINDFINYIGKFLEIDKLSNKIIDIKNDIFEEEANYIYELMFISSKKSNKSNDTNIELDKKTEDTIEDIDKLDKIEDIDKLDKIEDIDKLDNNEDIDKLDNNEDIDKIDNNVDNDDMEDYEINEIAMIINKEPIIIKGNVIIFKEYTPSLTNEVSFKDMFKNNLEQLLLSRKYKTVVVWDDSTMKWREDKMIRLSDYIKDFFDEEPDTKHIEFLMHKIHIFYIYSKYGNKYVCGRLLNDIPIEKCLIMTMHSEDYLGNITLDEVSKMIKLSEKIERYVIPSEFSEDTIAQNGRTIKNNKYKILDKVYNKYY